MTSRQQFRFQCLQLANILGAAKVLKPHEIIPTAMEYFKWVDDNPDEPVEVDRLALKYQVSKFKP